MNNDLISRSVLLAKMKALDIWHETEYQEGYFDGFNDGIAEVEEAPAVDAVEVVRCKDCDNLTFIEGPYGTVPCCIKRSLETVNDMNGFCSYGERRSVGT